VKTSHIDFLNVGEVIGDKELWNTFDMKGEFHTYVIKMRMKAVFNEQMEVHNFPCDIQPMNIPLTFNACQTRVLLEENKFYPSIFFNQQFQSESVYDVVYEDIVLTRVAASDPSESSAGYVYPRCFFSVYFARKPYYYVSNVAMPLTVLTLLGMYVCMYVWVYVCLCVCMCMYVYICVYVRMWQCP
jgi:hypothetical protein